jgi:hypothetical protein
LFFLIPWSTWIFLASFLFSFCFLFVSFLFPFCFLFVSFLFPFCFLFVSPFLPAIKEERRLRLSDNGGLFFSGYKVSVLDIPTYTHGTNYNSEERMPALGQWWLVNFWLQGKTPQIIRRTTILTRTDWRDSQLSDNGGSSVF